MNARFGTIMVAAVALAVGAAGWFAARARENCGNVELWNCGNMETANDGRAGAPNGRARSMNAPHGESRIAAILGMYE